MANGNKPAWSKKVKVENVGTVDVAVWDGKEGGHYISIARSMNAANVMLSMNES